MDNWKRFPDDCEILLNTNLTKLDDLATTLNSVNNDIHLSIELSENRLLFLDILIINSGKKLWRKIYSKPTHSKRYISYLSNHPKPYFKNLTFRLARRICMVVENKNVRCIKLRTLLETQKYPKMIVEKRIEKVLAIPQKQLRRENL